MPNNDISNRIRGQVQALLKKGHLNNRRSIFNETISSSSDLDKTLSNLGRTFNFMNDFTKELDP